MRLVTYTDDNGYNRQALLRDNQPDDEAHKGIQLDPPSLTGLHGIPENVKRALHNALLARGLYCWADVLRLQNGVTGVVRVVTAEHQLDEETAGSIKRQILHIYKKGG